MLEPGVLPAAADVLAVLEVLKLRLPALMQLELLLPGRAAICATAVAKGLVGLLLQPAGAEPLVTAPAFAAVLQKLYKLVLCESTLGRTTSPVSTSCSDVNAAGDMASCSPAGALLGSVTAGRLDELG